MRDVYAVEVSNGEKDTRGVKPRFGFRKEFFQRQRCIESSSFQKLHGEYDVTLSGGSNHLSQLNSALISIVAHTGTLQPRRRPSKQASLTLVW